MFPFRTPTEAVLPGSWLLCVQTSGGVALLPAATQHLATFLLVS